MPPLSDPVLCVELGHRVCTALMTQKDWEESLERMTRLMHMVDVMAELNG